MNISKKFSGQPIIKQILSFISKGNVYRTAEQYKSDRYTKRFTTFEHLVTMLFAVLSGCSSLREVTSIMLACEGKLSHLGIKHFPRRSTLADANKRRSSQVFGTIYYQLYNYYKGVLSDNNNIFSKIVNTITIIFIVKPQKTSIISSWSSIKN